MNITTPIRIKMVIIRKGGQDIPLAELTIVNATRIPKTIPAQKTTVLMLCITSECKITNASARLIIAIILVSVGFIDLRVVIVPIVPTGCSPLSITFRSTK